MRVVKHQDLREFMRSLDHEEYTGPLEVLVKFYAQYVYTARISYNPYSRCWRCLSRQTTDGSIHVVADARIVRAYIEQEVRTYQGYVIEDVQYHDEACMPPSPINVNWNTPLSTSATSEGDNFSTQVLSWLSNSTEEV